jgi:hypothetical protein
MLEILRDDPIVQRIRLAVKANPEMRKHFTEVLRAKCRHYGFETNVDNLEYFLDRPSPCVSPFAGIVYINKDGYLAPCCNYAHRPLASVFETGLRGALESQPATEFRRLMLDEDYPDHCRSWCGMRSRPQPGPSRANVPGFAGHSGGPPAGPPDASPVSAEATRDFIPLQVRADE